MTRKNVTVESEEDGYCLCRGNRLIHFIGRQTWQLLGLKSLAIGRCATIDLRVSGLPKKRKSIKGR